MTRDEALAELIKLNAEADARQVEIDAMVAEYERLHGPDPLGYDNDRPVLEVARETAKDTLLGRNRGPTSRARLCDARLLLAFLRRVEE